MINFEDLNSAIHNELLVFELKIMFAFTHSFVITGSRLDLYRFLAPHNKYSMQFRTNPQNQ